MFWWGLAPSIVERDAFDLLNKTFDLTILLPSI
jgi:hypothetical protein